MPKRIIEYKLSWEMPKIWWMTGHQNATDFTDIWDQIPWGKPTVKITQDLDEIMDQWRVLLYWQGTKSQPIRNVHVSTRSYEPTDWAEMPFPGENGGTGSLPPVSSR